MDRRIVRISVINDISYDQRMLKTAQSLYEHNYEVHIIGRLLPNSKSIENYAFTPHRLQCVFNKGKLFYIEYNIRLILFMLFKSKGIYVATDLDTLFAMRTQKEDVINAIKEKQTEDFFSFYLKEQNLKK